MNKSNRLSVFRNIFSLTVLCSAHVMGAPTDRDGYFGKPIPDQSGPNDVFHRKYLCGGGQFLVGLGLYQTDRLVGLSFTCTTSAKDQTWSGVPGTDITQFVKKSGDVIRNVTCPKNYYLVGFQATWGTYSADTHGAATVGAQLLADLMPVCRDNKTDDLFVFPTGRLRQADNNNLADVPWQGFAGDRSCASGTGAVGVKMVVDFRRGEDPDRKFEDIALICDGLPIDIGKIASPVAVPH